ncbi:MAG: beta-Ala-His dipeptidase [Oscillospiraceae bacterium]|nr:beta-Ala-His dipeptidase [Oscillospiraceae bacterium]
MEFDLTKKQCFYFNEISRIPRGSGNEKAVSDYIVSFAKERGLAYKQDEVWNVIVDKPATPGYEGAPTLVIQAHTDMVNEKNKGVEHDFEKDPLDLYVDGDLLRARGTTLGADDGYGVAYMLAILDNEELEHPALSCVFTTMEEIGLIGAGNLKPEDVHGSRYINLDAGGEVGTYVSSAGGATAVMTLPLEKEKNDRPAYLLSIRGLKGGHSGAMIHLELGNANLLLVRALQELKKNGADVQLVSFNGGMQYNAVPREADALFVSGADFDRLSELVSATEKDLKAELEFSDPDVRLELSRAEAEDRLTQRCSDSFLNFVFLMPDGMKHRSMVIEDLTVSSLNAGVVTTKEDEIVIEDLIRSALESHTETLIEQLNVLADLLGWKVEIKNRITGWGFNAVSPLREILKGVLAERGIEMQEMATHGGLECGVFKGLRPDLDIITYGPVAEGEHTPDESLDLASFDRAYEILCEVIRRAK